MPAENPVKECPGCEDRDVRKTLPYEAQCNACRKKERNRLWREANPGAMAANARRWREAGNKTARPEGYAEQHRDRERNRYQEDPNHRERVKQRTKEWKKNNPERSKELITAWYEKHVDERRKYTREWNRAYYSTPEGRAKQAESRMKHRAARQASRAAYYAKRYGRAGEITNEQLNWLHKWQDHCCCYCNASLEGRETIEHVVPLDRGGENNPHNVLLACGYCNSSKQHRLLDESEWAPRLVQPASRFHSAYATGVALKRLHATGLDARLSESKDVILLPNGRTLAVMSSFWLAERAEPPVLTVVNLHELIPDAVLTFDYEWLHHPMAMLNVVAAKGGAAEAIGARELDIDSPQPQEAAEFMKLWHVQGSAPGSWYVGLRHPKTREWHGMLSVRQTEAGYELARMAFRGHVPGGVTRMISAFRRMWPAPAPIWTYADSRFGEGGGYLASGFQDNGQTDGWYGYVNGVGMHSRLAFRKDRMATDLDFFDPEWTERRLARANGLWRLEGLPQKRFVMAP